nr:hypothetical protein CFP56_43763 [Quercus suber]
MYADQIDQSLPMSSRAARSASNLDTWNDLLSCSCLVQTWTECAYGSDSVKLIKPRLKCASSFGRKIPTQVVRLISTQREPGARSSALGLVLDIRQASTSDSHNFLHRSRPSNPSELPVEGHGCSRERPTKRRPFSNWVKRIANFKGGDQQGSSSKRTAIPRSANKSKKTSDQNTARQDQQKSTYLQPDTARRRDSSSAGSVNGQLSFATPSTHAQHSNGSMSSLPLSMCNQREEQSNGSQSNAPTVATDPETIHSDAGQSKAPTIATGAGALSSLDGAGGGSTFSSPNQSERSLTTTLTTIQSQSAGAALQQGAISGPSTSNTQTNQNAAPFSHQYPVATPNNHQRHHFSHSPPHLRNDSPKLQFSHGE